VLQRTTYQWRLRVPSFHVWSLGLHYRLPPMAGMDHRVSVNVNNLLDREYLRVNRLIGEKRAIYFTYSINRAPRR
jgi:outer membrane receptor protein involved in Fe transport